MSKLINLGGKRFFRLLVISRSVNGKYGSPRWNCMCDCGNTSVCLGSHLRRGKIKSCGCYLSDATKIRCRSGTKNISGHFWYKVKYNAKRKSRNLEFSITKEYAQNLLEQQKFKCALSKEDIILNIENTFKLTGRYNLNTASLDRIDPSKGYIEGNVQWVHKDINKMKWDLVESRFLYLCEKVYNVLKDKNEK